MKIKFTLQRPAGPVDLVASVDSSATVGDVARYLAAADPARTPVSAPAELTLGLYSHALDPRQPLVDSGLRSGAAVSLSRSGVTHADPSRAAAAVLRVLDGPDAGREYQLPSGSSVIGRERGSEVRLTDTLISRRHARVNVSEVVEIIDLGSANGVQIDGLPVPRSILRAGDVVQIGDTRLSVRLLSAPSTAGGAAATGHIRSPRLDPVYAGQKFEAPELPERGKNQRFPLISMLAPLLMAGVLYAVTKSLYSLLFIALSPIMMLGGYFESRWSNKADYKAALKDFRAEVDSLVTDMGEAAEREITARQAETPGSYDCLDAARGSTPLLWARRPGERGFAEVRLGLGALPSRSTVELPSPKRSTRTLLHEVAEAVAPYASVMPVPVVGALPESAIGVGGPRDLALPVARAVLTQLSALHSPAELVLCATVSSSAAPAWDWLKWLPHTSSLTTPVEARHLASSPAAGAALISALEALLEQRKGDDAKPVPAVVLLVEDSPVEHARLVQLAEHGAAFGVHVVWVAGEVAALPAACKIFIEVDRQGVAGSVGFVHTATAVMPVQLEVVSAEDAVAFARTLSPIVDVGARIDDSSDLPRSVSLLTINGPELASSSEAVIERWAESRSLITGPFAPPSPPRHAGNLRAVIGEAAGEKLALDLRTDGPHALVGGTTGAGKSELLQAWILAMAAAHSPQRLTFLLVDYKGGSAFRDCVELPHTVGLVTDLSPHLVRRALTSLSAELKYREHVLAQHSAKDLVTLEKQGVPDAPPSLVIVVDEFAALVSEVPEFVDGVVNVAQRGRSLGLHLILATQRPAGVIKDNLRANTNLRLALRMADEADSTDVLGAPDAAFFDPEVPGRAVSKTGPGRLVPFQTGYAGGWTTDEPPKADIRVEELGFGAARVWEPSEAVEVATAEPGATDIRRLVASIKGASRIAEIAEPRKPWLPELKAGYDLADRSIVPNRRVDTELVFGLRDDPDNQTQPTVAFQPDKEGNLAVYGTGGSGKSTLLRTLAIAAGFTVHGGPCHVYGMDFGARGLSMLEELPHVGSIISGGDHERISRLLGWLRALIDERALRYSQVNAATITDYRRLAARPDEPRILLLVDGIAAFRQAYDTGLRMRWWDQFVSIASDGRQVGVHVILSSDQRTGMPPALASAVQSRIVLRMASPDDYGMLGVPHDVLGQQTPPGRGLLEDGEIQVATLGGTSDVVAQADAVKAFAAAMRKSGATPATPIGSLTDNVALTDLPAAIDGEPVIGMASATLAPFGFEPRGTFVISGPPASGRTTALTTVVTALRRWRPDVSLYYFGPARSSLAQLSVWREKALTADAASALASRLASDLPARLPGGGPVAIVLEGVGDLANSMADMALQDLVKVCLAEDHLVVSEGETSTLSGGFGLLGLVKGSRSGLALQPDEMDGNTVFRTDFPRINRAEFPPGRAIFVRSSKPELVHVALPGGVVAEGGVLPIDQLTDRT